MLEPLLVDCILAQLHNTRAQLALKGDKTANLYLFLDSLGVLHIGRNDF